MKKPMMPKKAKPLSVNKSAKTKGPTNPAKTFAPKAPMGGKRR